MQLFNDLPTAALLLSSDGQILQFNSRAETLLGNPENIVGSNFASYISAEDLDAYIAFHKNISLGSDAILTINLYTVEQRATTFVTIKGALTDSKELIFLLEYQDPCEPGCGKKCLYGAILEAQFQNNPGGILLVDQNMKMISFNKEFINMWNIPIEVQESRDERESIKSVLDQVIDPESFTAKIRDLYDKPEEISTDEVFLKNGRVFYRYTYPIYDNRKYLGRVWHFLDVSPLKQANYKIEQQQVFQNAILEHIQDGVIACDAAGNISLLNRASRQLYRENDSDILPDNLTALHMYPQETRHGSPESSPLAKALAGDTIKNEELSLLSNQGDSHWLRVSGQPMYDSEGYKLGAVISLHDITDLKKTKEQLHYLAYHDSLTNLPNRRLFHDLLTQSLKQAHRNNQQVGILFLDLDNFKSVNDLHGHAVGDELLAKVANCLHDCLRDSDIICRWGGDEFVIGLLESDGQEAILKVSEKLSENVLSCVQKISEPTRRVSISIGIALYPDHGEEPDLLIRNADVAMYQAKQQGKNRCVLFR